jgi:site-specific recombinase XerD
MTTNDLMGWFKSELLAVRGVSQSTTDAYCESVEKYAAWMGARKTTDISPVLVAERADLLDYRQHLSLRLAASSTARHFAALKRLYDMLVVQSRLVKNPYPLDMVIRVKTQEPTDVPTASQFFAIRRWFREQGNLQRIALFELLAGSGLRIDAALTLKPHHLKLSSPPIDEGTGAEPRISTLAEMARTQARDFIVVDHEMGCKGKYAGTIPITPSAASWVRTYLNKQVLSEDRPVFDIAYSTAHRVISTGGGHAEPAIEISPHSMRHFYCAMTYYKSMAGDRHNILATQHAMGHSNMTITSRYLQMAERICQNDAEWNEWANGPVVHAEAAVA